MLRAQIEQNRRQQLEKIRARQQGLRMRQEEIKQEKLMRLNERIDHAREIRNLGLTQIKQKAQMEIENVEDVKYINRMNQNNLILDINNKLNENEERRNMIIKEQMKRLEEQKLKEEEVLKRRDILKNSKLEEIRKAELKRQQA